MEAMTDPRLSWKAKGIYYNLLQIQQEYETDVSFVSLKPLSSNNEKTTRQGLEELIVLGYVVSETKKDEKTSLVKTTYKIVK